MLKNRFKVYRTLYKGKAQVMPSQALLDTVSGRKKRFQYC